MKNYVIKLYLQNGNYGYYRGIFSGVPYITDDISSSRFYDTADEAYEAYRKMFYGKGLMVNGSTITRYTLVEVNV